MLRHVYDDLNPRPSRISITNPSSKSADNGKPEPVIKGLETFEIFEANSWLIYGTVAKFAGVPPLVSFPDDKTVLKLEPDNGHHFIDQNAARMNGRSAMVPGLAACYAYDKAFKIEDYDVITDRNNLIKLFELLNLGNNTPRPIPEPRPTNSWRGGPSSPGRGQGWRGGSRNFTPPSTPQRPRGIESMERRPETSRIDIDVVSGYDHIAGEYLYDPSSPSQTLILTRWEPLNEEIVHSATDFRGFGFSFLFETRQFLSLEGGKIVERDPKEITGYHCLVKYHLFGLRILVRYHADACDMTRQEFTKWVLKDGLRDIKGASGERGDDSDEEKEEEEEDLINLLEDSDTFDLLDSFKTLNIAEEPSEKDDIFCL
ncbi:hypothetical protein ABW20_dc0101093 [Dactylellina cionopaga]|nr:hypothetical protein ABW20_dc0101093 [Dactylellina cionopaga]